MGIFQFTGLEGLKGLEGINSQDQASWRLQNKDKLKGKGDAYANGLYRNQMYIKLFGLDKFKNTQGWEREQELDNYIIGKTFENKFKPTKNNVGLGERYLELSRIDAQAKKDLIEALDKEGTDKLETEEAINSRKNELTALDFINSALFRGSATSYISQNLAYTNPYTKGAALNAARAGAHGALVSSVGVVDDKSKARRNDIINKIQQESLEREENKRSGEEAAIRQAIANNYSTTDIEKMFEEAVDTSNGLGNNYFNAYKKESEMANFSISDKIDYLAKREMAYKYFNPQDAYTYLNNYAKNYIADNQSTMTKLGLSVKDIGVSATTYALQGTTGSLGYLRAVAEDKIDDLGVWTSGGDVWVDINGQIYSDNQVKGGVAFNGQKVQKKHLSQEALFLAGKNDSGDDLLGIWNLDYLEKAQRYRTFDTDEIANAEANGGVSIYSTASRVGDDEESIGMAVARMMSFGLTDVAFTAATFGAGTAIKGLGVVGKIAASTSRAAKLLKASASAIGKVGKYANSARSTSGIALAYGKGVYDKALAHNLEANQQMWQNLSSNQAKQWTKEHKDEYDKAVDEEFNRLKKIDQERVKSENNSNIGKENRNKVYSFATSDETLRERAKQNVINSKVGEFYEENIKRGQAFENVAEAHRDAAGAALNSYITEAGKYALVNAGWRKFLLNTPSQQAQASIDKMSSYIHEGVVNGSKKLIKDSWKKKGEIWKATKSVGWGGAWTNYTDEMQSDFALGFNNTWYDRYIASQHDGTMTAHAYGDREYGRAFLTGTIDALDSMTKGSTIMAGVVGGLGSALPGNFLKVLNVPQMKAEKRKFMEETKKLLSEGKISEAQAAERDALYSNRSNWEKLNDYISLGGIAETYYGNKNAYRQLGVTINQVNEDLDKVDWDALRKLYYNANDDTGTILDKELDKKDSTFLNAMHALDVLHSLEEAANTGTAEYAALLQKSSVLKEGTELIQAAKEGELSSAQKETLLEQWYANHLSETKSEENDKKALKGITSNITKLVEAQEGLDKAREEISEYRKKTGTKSNPIVDSILAQQMAFQENNNLRAKQMEKELSGNEQATFTDEGSRQWAATFGDSEVSMQDHLDAITSAIEDVEKEQSEFQKKTINPLNEKLEKLKKEQAKHDEHSLKYHTLQSRINETQKNIEAAQETNTKYTTTKEELLSKGDALAAQIAEFKGADLERANENKHLSIEEVLLGGKIDLSNTEEVDAAVKKVLQLPVADRARLFESIKLARQQREENKDNDLAPRIYNERNFKVLDAIMSRIETTDPTILDKVRDTNILHRRVRNLQKTIDFAKSNPEAMLSRLNALENIDNIHASYKWNKRIADWYKDAEEAFTRNLPMSLSRSDRDKANRQAYATLFANLVNTHSDILNHIINNKKEYSRIYNVALEAKRFKDKLSDIHSSVYRVLSNTNLNEKEKQEYANKFIRDVLDHLDAEIPRAEDLIYALDEMKRFDKASGTDRKVGEVLDALIDLDNQRNSTFVQHSRRFNSMPNRVKSKQSLSTKQRRDASIAILSRLKELNKQREVEEKAKQEEKKKKAAEAKPTESTNPPKNTSTSGDIVPAIATEAGINPSEVSETSPRIDMDLDDDTSPAPKETPSNNSESSGSKGEEKTGSGNNASNSTPSSSNKEGERITYENVKYKDKVTDRNGVEYIATGVSTGSTGNKTIHFLESKPENPELPKMIFVYSQESFDEHFSKESSAPINPISTVENSNESTDIPLSDLTKEAKEKKGGEKLQELDTLPPAQNEQAQAEEREIPNTLLGFVMSEYEYKYGGLLDKVATRKRHSPGDVRDKFFKWIDKEGIKLQNIVDFELGDILRENPDTPIHVMHVLPDSKNGDNAVQDILFNVIEYTDKVAKHHNEKNGGVIESNGKKYLIVGTTGYAGTNSPQFSEWKNMADDIKQTHWQHNKDQRFFISKYHTKVNKLKDGYIVKSTESHQEAVRPITELLSNEQSNPKGVALEDLAWGIQKHDGFVTVNVGNRKFYSPNKEVDSWGNVFVFVEGANGSLIPAKIKAKYLSEVDRNSTIGKRVVDLVTKLTDTNHDVRLDAIKRLNRILFLTSEDRTRVDRSSNQGKIIYIGDEKLAKLTLKTGTVVEKTFDLNSPDLNINEVIDAVFKFNPRIQITPEMLSNLTSLEELAEAGALDTDIACLNAVGAEYFINSMDSEGNPRDSVIEPVRTEIHTKAATKDTVFYNGRTYYKNTDGKWQIQTKEGLKDVTSDTELNQVKLNQEIATAKPTQAPDHTVGNFDFYVMKDGDNPIVYRRHRTTNFVTEMSPNEGKIIINLMNKKKEGTAQEAAAKEAAPNAIDMEINPTTGATEQKPKTNEKDKSDKRTPAAKKSENIVSTIQKDSSQLQLTEDEHFYQQYQNGLPSGRFFIRVTSAIGAAEFGKRFDPNSPWKTPSTVIGNSMDVFVRDFFDGTLGDLNTLAERYPNASQEQLMNFYNQLVNLRNNVLKGKHVIGSGIKAIGSMLIKGTDGKMHNVDIAGTLDLLAYDDEGNFYIYDMKTKRSSVNADDMYKWKNQLSLYKQFLEDKYGIKVKETGIIPIHVEYAEPKGWNDATTEYSEAENNTLLADGKKVEVNPQLMPIVSIVPSRVNLTFDKMESYEKDYIKQMEEKARQENKTADEGVEARKGKTLAELQAERAKGTKTFSDIFREDPDLILSVLNSKYGDLGTDLAVITDFLKKKGINVDNISDIDSWIEYVTNCK